MNPFRAACPVLTGLALAARAAVADAPLPPTVRHLLLHNTHGMLPYAFPRETSFDELDRVLAHRFDIVGISFCGPYSGGVIDFAALDAAVRRIHDAGSQTLVHLMPRFLPDEAVGDTLNDGTRIPHAWNRNPNYAVIDVFDPAQTAKFNDYLARVAERYGNDPRIAAFCIGWGFQGETGFFTGDFNAGFEKMGSVSAGYSDHALRTFNAWRGQHDRPEIDALPQPSLADADPVYVDFMRFRSRWIANRFQADAARAMKRHTAKPVGLFAYLPAGKESYARNWVSTPNADFYRSAGSAASYDNARTLSDSGIGWEDSRLHAGRWDFTFAAMRRDQLRMMAHGAAFHAMFCRHYTNEPQWEPGVYDKVARFIRDEAPDLRTRIRTVPPDIGLLLPTWSCAAWPGRSEAQPFLPAEDLLRFIRQHVGIVESFGLRYRLLTEDDLVRPEAWKDVRLILVVAGNRLEPALDDDTLKALREATNVAWLDFTGQAPSRAAVRAILRRRGVPVFFDHDGDLPIAGMVGNIVFNWRPEPTRVRYATATGPVDQTLGPHEVVFLDDVRALRDEAESTQR